MDKILLNELAGRLVRKEELTLDAQLLIDKSCIEVEKVKAFKSKGQSFVCERCGSHDDEQRSVGPCLCDEQPCFYCTNCLQMGKIKKCTTLYYMAEPTPSFPLQTEVPIVYKGSLSPLQKQISSEIKQLVKQKGAIKHLIWAVTGAGKTEMIFESLQSCIQAGGRVAVASPRIDVCLELAQRIGTAFPTVEQVVLYGTSEMTYIRVPLTILTTHQLLRFRKAFDLLIVDEVDAFPYANSEMLQYGTKKALKEQGKLIILTATPSKEMQQEIQAQKLTTSILAARYHRYPLVVPQRVWIGNWKAKIKRKKLPKKIQRWMEKQFEERKRFLLFVPQIELLKPLSDLITCVFPNRVFAAVSSKEPERKKIVQQMRDEELDFLITTTILERGVTFFDTQVAVLGAEEDIFTSEVLIQIAGRVGRHPAAPSGLVTFFHYGQTKAIKQAVKEIRMMNARARKKGLLHDEMPMVPNE